MAAAPTNLARGGQSAALPSFVAGPENCLVAAMVERLMKPQTGMRDTSNPYPPILALFGPNGVGKTHLAAGLARHWQRQLGDGAAYYLTAADFRRDYFDAIDTNRLREFRDRYRTRRMLAIDDIHRLPKDEHITQELRYLVDSIEESGGLLLVTSNRPADTLSNLPADLRSRLSAGLSLQLAPPGSEARMRIIRYASQAIGMELNADIATQLAGSSPKTATQTFAELFEHWLAPPNGDNPQPHRQPTLQQIISAVARYTRVPQKLLKSGSRRQSVVFARAIAIYLARELTPASYEQIGRTLGGRDHTTVMYNYEKIECERTKNVATQEAIEELRRTLLHG